jgi:hypothetical protein
MNKQDIMNAALTKIGSKVQTNFDADSDIQLWYNIVKEYILLQHWWTFTKTIIPLTLLTTTVPNYQYQYQLPNDIGMIWDVYPHYKYEIYNGNLVSDRNPLSLIYSTTTYGDNFDALVGVTIASFLAKEIATVRKMDTSLINILSSESIALLASAISSDSSLISSLTIRSDRYLQAR